MFTGKGAAPGLRHRRLARVAPVMPSRGPMGAREDLTAIFDSDRTAAAAEERLLETDRPTLLQALCAAVDEALGLEPEEAGRRLSRLSDLCAQIPGPEMVDAVLRILGHDDPAVRVAAGEALLEVGYERYAELARAIDRALERGLTGPGAAELPWIIAEIAEPSAGPLIARFLQLPDADVVASAIEALAHLGDPAHADAVEPFLGDDRTVTLDEHDQETTTTIGELAAECLAVLDPDPDEDR